MSPRKPSFPASVRSHIQPPHAVVYDRAEEEIWLDEHAIDPSAAPGNLLSISPFAPDYQIDMQGHPAVPVTIAGYRKSVRGWVKRWLSMQYGDHGERSALIEQLQRWMTPEIFDTNHFWTDRPIGKNGTEVELERDRSDWVWDGHGLLLPRSGAEGMSEQQLAEMFPASRVLRGQLFDLVHLPDVKPVQWQRTYNAPFGTEKGMVTEQSEQTPLPEGPLTPAMRTILEQHGKIVYEHIAPNADRILICFKHLHGFQGDQLLHTLLDGGKIRALQMHKSGIISAQEKLLDSVDPKNVRFYCESSPRSFAGADSKMQEVMKMAAAGMMYLLNPEKRRLLTQELSRKMNMDATFVHTVLFDTENPDDHVLRFTMQNNIMDHLHGDGRSDLREELQEKKVALEQKMLQIAKHQNQVGAAADMAALFRERSDIIDRIPQKGISTEIAASLQAHELGLLTYGGGHFKHGLTNETDIHTRTFEDYFQFLPRVQVLVVEELSYTSVHNMYEAMRDQILLKDPTKADQKLSQLQLLNTLCMTANLIVVEYVASNALKREKLTIELQSIMQEIQCLFDDFRVDMQAISMK